MGLVQERRNSSALAMELRLSCINPSIFSAANLALAGFPLTKNLGENLPSRL